MIIPRKVLAASLLVLVLAAAAYFLVFKKGPAEAGQQAVGAAAGEAAAPAPGAPEEKTEAAPIPVKTTPAHRGDLVMTLKSPGEAYTDRKITLKNEVGGWIKNLYVREGLHVKENDILVEIEDTEYRLRLEKQQALRLRYLSEYHLEKQFAAKEQDATPEALANLSKTQAEHDQALAAFQAGKITAAELEKSQRAYELAQIASGRKKDEIIATTKNLTGAEIDVKTANRELEKTVIRAPFGGILTDIKVSARERLDGGREICTLVDISRIKVKAKVLESEIGKMQTGREVDLHFSAYPGKVFKGVVEAVSPVINTEDKTCAVHIAMNNVNEQIKPGMHAEVEIAAEIHKDRLLVPQDALLVRGGRKLVFVVENGIAKWRYVEIGLENEHFAEILPSTEPGWGIAEGEQVIIEGHFTLAHDAKVQAKQ